MAYAAGVDVGSTQTKAVIIDEDRNIVGRSLLDTGANVVKAAESAYASALEARDIEERRGRVHRRHGLRPVSGHVRQHPGHRDQLPRQGAVHLFPGTRTVVDMGGRTPRRSGSTASGEIGDFCMNDKCAAGTGRFLGAAAAALEPRVERLGPISLKSERPIKISTTCTVFAESEVLAWLGKGKKIEDILWGVHQSIASRSVGLMRRVGVKDEVTFTGGVTLNVAMVKALEERLGIRLQRQRGLALHGALGAALFAHDHMVASRAPTRRGARGDVMTMTAGIDVGSTYTKVVILDAPGDHPRQDDVADRVPAREIAAESLRAMPDRESGIGRDDVGYVIATGIGRHQVDFKDLHVTDLTASSQGRPALSGDAHGPRCRRADDESEPPRRAGQVRPFGSTTNVPPAPGPSSRRRPGTWATPPWRLAAHVHLQRGGADLRRVCRLRRIGGDQPPLPRRRPGRHHAGCDRVTHHPLGAN